MIRTLEGVGASNHNISVKILTNGFSLHFVAIVWALYFTYDEARVDKDLIWERLATNKMIGNKLANVCRFVTLIKNVL